MPNEKKKDVFMEPFPVKEDKTELSTLLEQARMDFANQIEICRMRAQLNKVFYDELVKNGFSKEQALELVKAKGV